MKICYVFFTFIFSFFFLLVYRIYSIRLFLNVVVKEENMETTENILLVNCMFDQNIITLKKKKKLKCVLFHAEEENAKSSVVRQVTSVFYFILFYYQNLNHFLRILLVNFSLNNIFFWFMMTTIHRELNEIKFKHKWKSKEIEFTK